MTRTFSTRTRKQRPSALPYLHSPQTSQPTTLTFPLFRRASASAARHRDFAQKSLNLTESRYNRGLVNQLDVTRAKLELSNVVAQLEDTSRQRAALKMPSPPSQESSSLFTLTPDPLIAPTFIIPEGLPSDILLQRPDIAQLERTMASEHALIGVAYASYFIHQHTGALGYFSPLFKDFMTFFSRYWSTARHLRPTFRTEVASALTLM